MPATNANPTAPAVAPAAADSSISLIDDFKLPLLAILVVLLIGFLGWRMTREKNSPPEFSPAPRLPVAPTPTAPKPVAGRLTPHSEAITALDLEPRRAPGATADSVKPAIAAQLYADDAAPAKTPLLIDAKPARGAAVAADPDIATQLKAQTVPVNLDVNDPLSEADFHLAYGLYDEAATLLRRGLEKEPTRKDLRVKLAETYYGAGKVAEFQQTALALRGQISAADWDKLAEMGRKIAPDIGAFKAPGTAAIVPPRPAPPAAVPPSSLMSAPAPPPAPPAAFDLNLGAARATPASAPPPAAVDRTIDFDLDTALTKPYDKPTPAIADLNLHQFDNGIDFEPDTGLLQAPQKTVSAPPFELGSFDAPAHHTLADAPAPLRLDDLDFASPAPIDHAELGAENEISTKLDLARAYADMGDNEAASGLLREVILAGSAAQKQEAEGLAKRLLSA